MAAIPDSASPCRIATKERRRHHCSREHANLVHSYHAARHAWELWAEDVAIGYKTELAEFKAEHPPITFRQFLVGQRESQAIAA